MISTNMKKAYWPGNIILNPDESGLPKKSIVIISKSRIISKDKIGICIGKIGQGRIDEIRKEIASLNDKIERRRLRK